MQHFPIVIALLRASVRGNVAAATQHAERLRDALLLSGNIEKASAITEILNPSQTPDCPPRVKVVKSMRRYTE